MRLKQILLLALIVSWLRQTDRQTDRHCHLLSCPGQLKKDFLPQNDQIWPKIGIFGQFGPGHAGFFGALLVGGLVVVARGLYLARHLFTLCYLLTASQSCFSPNAQRVRSETTIIAMSEKLNQQQKQGSRSVIRE